LVGLIFRCLSLITMASMLPVWGQNYVTGPDTGAASALDSTQSATFPLSIIGTGTFDLACSIFYMKEGPATTADVTLTIYNSAAKPIVSLILSILSNSEFCLAFAVGCQSYSYHTFTFPSPLPLPPGFYTLVLSSTAPPQQNMAYTVKGAGTSFTVVAGGVPGTPDLTVAKITTPPNFNSRAQAGYTVQVINVGNAPSSGKITVTDILDPNLTFISASGSNWSCNAAAQIVTCVTSDTIPEGASAPLITIAVNVMAQAGTSVIDTVTVAGGGDANPSNNSFQLVSNVNAPDLSISKTSIPAAFIQGQNGAIYTIQVSNLGNADSSGMVTVTDTLDPNLTFVSAGGSNWNCNAVAQLVTCTSSAAIAAGASASPITIVVNVAAHGQTTVTNAVTVAGGGEFNTSNNSFQLVSNVNAPDLNVLKTATPFTFTQGQNQAIYTIQAGNVGNAPSSGMITVTDTLDPNLTFVLATGSNWNCNAAAQVVTCTTSAAIAAGASASPITIAVNVAAHGQKSVTNAVTIAGGGDANPSNNSFQLVTLVDAVDLTVLKTSTPATFIQGQNGVTYTITASNVGNLPSSGMITVTDTLDPNLTFVSATGSNWSCNVAAQVVTCTTSATIPAEASMSPITIAVNVAARGQTTVTNAVTIAGGGDTNPSNNSFQLVSDVNAPDLSVSKSSTPGTFTQGQNGVIYSILARNVGNAPSSGTITVTDTLDPNLSFVSATGSNWNCNAAAQVVTCTTSAAIAAAASASPIMITVNVAAHAAASVTNRVTVAGGGESNTSNNSFQLVSAVNPASFTIEVTGGGSQSTVISTAFGQVLEATVNDSNGNPVSGVTVTFTAPTSGASAILSSPTAVTDSNGHARVTATANGTAGTYSVTATAVGATGSAIFGLTNTTATPPVQTVPATTTPILILSGMGLIAMVVWLRRRAVYLR
jgi:uncharacterized repeat protein (TIGR01451 family)